MILMIDNYDSFTYNIVQYLLEFESQVVVKRNDQITLDEIFKINPSAIVISPGPATPTKAGISIELVKKIYDRIPILGVCLGHQIIAKAFGAKIIPAKTIMHGKVSMIYHDGKKIFDGMPSPFKATRYHSLAVEKYSLPSCFEISAQTSDGEIMGIRHKEFEIEGVQFHPESILTENGKTIILNFLKLVNAQ